MAMTKFKRIAAIVAVVMGWWLLMGAIASLGVAGNALSMVAVFTLAIIISFVFEVGVAVGRVDGIKTAAADLRAWAGNP
jgi:hypothetical protein